MKELVIFRIFALFPFIGILIPDLASKFDSFSSRISTDHIIIDVALSICIALCSIGIWRREHKQLKNSEEMRFNQVNIKSYQ
jgi:hypothetical protein